MTICILPHSRLLFLAFEKISGDNWTHLIIQPILFHVYISNEAQNTIEVVDFKSCAAHVIRMLRCSLSTYYHTIQEKVLLVLFEGAKTKIP